MTQQALEPRAITVLVIDSNPASREATLELLAESGYKVRGPPGSPAKPPTPALADPAPPGPPQTLACARGSEALDLLSERVRATGSPGVEVVLKDHAPPASNAVRFLHRLAERPALAGVLPIGERPLPALPPCMAPGNGVGVSQGAGWDPERRALRAR